MEAKFKNKNIKWVVVRDRFLHVYNGMQSHSQDSYIVILDMLPSRLASMKPNQMPLKVRWRQEFWVFVGGMIFVFVLEASDLILMT